MSLLDLPPELLHTICELCEPVDLRNLRLTCRVLRDTGDDLLLDGIMSFYHQKHLGRFHAITKAAPGIRKGIKSFTFSLDNLKPINRFEAWDAARSNNFKTLDRLSSKLLQQVRKKAFHPHEKRIMDSLENFRKENAFCNKNRGAPLMQERYVSYRELADYQEDIERGSFLREMLSAFFKACPSLTSLEFGIHEAFLEDRILDSTFQSGLIIPFGACDGGLLGFKETMLAAYDADFQPQNLTISNLHSCIAFFDDVLMEKASRILQKVTSVRWNFDFAERGEQWDLFLRNNDSPADQKQIRFLSCCERLEALNLSGSVGSTLPEEVPLLHLRRVVGKTFWPGMRSLSLICVQVTSHDLADMLLRHGDTLTELHLGDMYAVGDRWEDCFAMFAGKLKALKVVRLEDLFRSSPGGEIEYFFTGRSYSDQRSGHDPEPFIDWILHGGSQPTSPEYVVSEDELENESVEGDSTEDGLSATSDS